MKKKKIALLLSTLDDGGAAAIVSQISTRLSNEFDIDIILNSTKKIKYPYDGRLIDLGINSIPQDRTNLLYQGRVFFVRWVKLRQLKKVNNYDVCVSYMDSANVVNILTKHANIGCKSVINIVNNMSGIAQSSKKYKWIVNPLIRFLYNRADAIIAQTRDIKKDLVNNYGIDNHKTHVIYSAVDIERIDSIIAEDNLTDIDFCEKWLDKKKTVLTAGRFVPQKGHGHLIRAFSNVVKTIEDAKLVIFGNGELKEYYNELIKAYNLYNNVVIHDFSPNYTWYISRCAIFAFPSIFEGFGMALQDAMACKVACVATDYKTGARELLADNYDGRIDSLFHCECGIIVKADNEKLLNASDELNYSELCLAQSIIGLLTDEKLREKCGNKAREKAEKYNLPEITNEWKKLMLEIIRQK